jgi:alkylated DNA repair dioxygenase AlkB
VDPVDERLASTTGPGLPSGFRDQPGFLSLREALALLDFARNAPYETFVFHGYLAKRRVAHFGFGYTFASHTTVAAPPIPEPITGILQRAAALAGYPPEHFGAALLTHYPPGAGIGWHRDAPSFGTPVIGISLGAPATLRLRPWKGAMRRSLRAAVLESGSIYVLDGEARYRWEHHIPPVSAERYSLTLRTVLGKTLR